MRHLPRKPWTAAHERFLLAVCQLHEAQARRGGALWPRVETWIEARWNVRLVIDLTPAQARHACREINAIRAGIEGRVTAPKTASSRFGLRVAAKLRKARAGQVGVLGGDAASEILKHFRKDAA